MNVSRRSFLGGALSVTAALAVPAFVSAVPVLHGDGIHDDAPALNALLSGRPFRTADGFRGIAESATLANGIFAVGQMLVFERDRIQIHGCSFIALPNFRGDSLLYFKCKEAVVSGVYLDCTSRGNLDGLRVGNVIEVRA